MNLFGDFKMLQEKYYEEPFQQLLKRIFLFLERIDKIFNNENNPNLITKNIVEYTPSKGVFDEKINEYGDKLKRVQNIPQAIKVSQFEIDFTEFNNE